MFSVDDSLSTFIDSSIWRKMRNQSSILTRQFDRHINALNIILLVCVYFPEMSSDDHVRWQFSFSSFHSLSLSLCVFVKSCLRDKSQEDSYHLIVIRTSFKLIYIDVSLLIRREKQENKNFPKDLFSSSLSLSRFPLFSFSLFFITFLTHQNSSTE